MPRSGPARGAPKPVRPDIRAANPTGRSPKILLATYFSDLGENLEFTLRLPVAGVHLDLVAVLASSRKLWRWRPTTCCCRSASWMAEISGGRIWIGLWR